MHSPDDWWFLVVASPRSRLCLPLLLSLVLAGAGLGAPGAAAVSPHLIAGAAPLTVTVPGAAAAAPHAAAPVHDASPAGTAVGSVPQVAAAVPPAAAPAAGPAAASPATASPATASPAAVAPGGITVGPSGGLVVGTAATTAAAGPAAAATPGVPTATVEFSGPTYDTDVLALMNQERAAHGLRALVSDPRLVASAYAHDLAMSAAGTMSHQLPGEAFFADRITAAGYAWSRAAENIGYTTQTTGAGVLALQQMMYDETPPDDGHRRNILDPALVNVGISVYVDARGYLWLTTDFATPR